MPIDDIAVEVELEINLLGTTELLQFVEVVGRDPVTPARIAVE
jgi:hypothetical protein